MKKSFPPKSSFKKATLALSVTALLAATVGVFSPGDLTAQIRRAAAAEEPEINVTGYRADVEVDPIDQTLRAIVTVDFIPTGDIATLTFGLNNALELHTVSDGDGNTIAGQRNGNEMTVRLLPVMPFPAGQPAQLIFNYAGRMTGDEESPVWGIKFAAIHEDYAYFMYPSRWLPLSGYTTDRFSMDLRVTTPAGYRVIASGTSTTLNRREVLAELAEMNGGLPLPETALDSVSGASATNLAQPSTFADERPRLVRRDGSEVETGEVETAEDSVEETAGAATSTFSVESTEGAEATITFEAVGEAPAELPTERVLPEDDGKITTQFVFNGSSFPGSFAVIRGEPAAYTANGIRSTFFFHDSQEKAANYATTVGEATEFLSSIFGPLSSPEMAVIETEAGAPNGYAAPGMIFLSTTAMAGTAVNTGTVVNNVARQWFPMKTSPKTRNHLWLENGIPRYAEILYAEEFQGEGAMQEQVKQVYVEALTVQEPPMVQAARLEDYSPEYWALTGGKGAAVLHMLRGVIGDDAFFETLRQSTMFSETDTFDFRDLAEDISGEVLNGFFLQWTESSGAPEFTMEYTVFRTASGFRVNGRIMQDLDLFRMPVKLRIETEGNPEERSVVVSGLSSEFAVETFGKPVDVILDPNGEVLRFNDDMRVAVAIKRGEQFAQISEFVEAIREYERALQVKRNSSLAQYRIAEVYFLQGNLQAAADGFREALSGDLDPAWVEVWSQINLGQIFDITGSRDRAVNAYRQALRTQDNTAGALEVAEQYLNEPYQRERDRF